jgi:6-methylsalicylate decarboxylase
MTSPSTTGSGRIDVHAHFVTETYRAALLRAGINQPDGMPSYPNWSSDEALSVMESAGIDTALLSVSSPGIYFGDRKEAAVLARSVNDEGAAIVADHSHRFGLLASLPLPDVSDAITEAARALDVLGVAGISLKTNYAGLYPGDPLLEPLFAMLDERAAVVVLHPTSPPGWEAVSFGRPRPMVEFLFDTTRSVFNFALSGTLSRFPSIRFVVPHCGGAVAALADRAVVFGRLGAVSGEGGVDVIAELRRLFYDVAGMPLPRVLPALLELVSIDQIVYGSDFPFTPAGVVRGHVNSLVTSPLLTETQRSAIFRGNALRLFPQFA